MLRLKLRVNGSARGVAARIDRFSEHEQFVATAARELEQPPPSDADKVKLYLHPDGDVVKVEDLEKDDVVVVAFSGSPFKEKLACVEGVGQAGCSAAALPPSCSQVEPRVRKVFETPLPLDPVRFETPFQTPMAAPPRPSCDSPQPAAVPMDLGPPPTDPPPLVPVSEPEESTAQSTLASALVVADAGGGGGFVQRVLHLAMAAERRTREARVVTTVDAEAAVSFRWGVADETPGREIIDGKYHAITIERISPEEWRVRCTSEPFISGQLRGEGVVRSLFDAGWFRAPQPKVMPRLPTIS